VPRTEVVARVEGSSLPPFDFAQDKLRRESRRRQKDWIPASAGITERAFRIPLPIFLHRAYGAAGFTGLIAGLYVKIDLRPFREELPNVPFQVFGDCVSL
jgi:hypothetical protein